MLEVRFGAEGKAAHVRVEPVGADHQVEVAVGSVLEAQSDAVGVLVDGGDRVAENGLDVVLDRGVDRPGEVAAGEADELAAGDAVEHARPQGGPGSALAGPPTGSPWTW